MRFVITLIQSNVYISVAAVLLTLATQVQLGFKPHLESYFLLIFFSTLAEYNIHRLVTVAKNKAALDSDKHRWVKQHLNAFYALVIFSMIGFILAIFIVEKKWLVAILPAALVTALYSIPISGFKSSRLRDLPYVKIFLISFVWSYVTVVLPYFDGDYKIEIEHVLLIFLERFLFIFTITIPFDIRDKELDAEVGLKTLPLLLNEKKALQLSYLVLFFFLIISVGHYIYTGQFYLLYATVVSSLITYIILVNNRLKTHTLYYYGFLDGTMILLACMILLSYFAQIDWF